MNLSDLCLLVCYRIFFKIPFLNFIFRLKIHVKIRFFRINTFFILFVYQPQFPFSLLFLLPFHLSPTHSHSLPRKGKFFHVE